MRTSGSRIAVPFVGCLLCTAASAQVTQRVSVNSSGVQGNYTSTLPAISADGRFVAFYSDAWNLVAGDTNSSGDVFVHDRQSGTTELASVSTSGTQGDGPSGYFALSISADGRYVAFDSWATNLIPGDTNGVVDVFVHDRQSGTTECMSVDSSGALGNSYSYYPSISADGRYVAFVSLASNLVSGDTNGSADIFIHDRQSGTTDRVSVDSSGVQGDRHSFVPSVNGDGRYVAFESYASNLVPGDTNGLSDVFVHDRQTGTTVMVSISASAMHGNRGSFAPSISADGRYVAFESDSSNLVTGDTNRSRDVFVHDLQSGATERVSVAAGGAQGLGNSHTASISADGRCVAFESDSSNLVAGDTNAALDVFVHDSQSNTTERVSVDSGGGQASTGSDSYSISADGRFVAFYSDAPNLVPGDTNGFWDTFVHDRDARGFTSLCDPGVGGVIPCPCTNPPSGSERGCDNSAATGGAALSASGIGYLSMDSLVFTTSSEKPTATSIVLQGTASPPAGIVYGQGVRCVGGTLKRLFVKTAVAGSITAPDFGAGDPTLSARSAAKGDVIQPGQSRYYLVYYRDPVVLGGCPASSTFNATQTGQVSWWP